MFKIHLINLDFDIKESTCNIFEKYFIAVKYQGAYHKKVKYACQINISDKNKNQKRKNKRHKK